MLPPLSDHSRLRAFIALGVSACMTIVQCYDSMASFELVSAFVTAAAAIAGCIACLHKITGLVRTPEAAEKWVRATVGSKRGFIFTVAALSICMCLELGAAIAWSTGVHAGPLAALGHGAKNAALVIALAGAVQLLGASRVWTLAGFLMIDLAAFSLNRPPEFSLAASTLVATTLTSWGALTVLSKLYARISRWQQLKMAEKRQQ